MSLVNSKQNKYNENHTSTHNQILNKIFSECLAYASHNRKHYEYGNEEN